MYRPCHHRKMSEIFKMLRGDGVSEKWKAIKNIEEPNPDRSSEFMCIGINYDEDQCNSIELQANELSGVCAHASMRLFVCVCVCVCVVGMCVIISFGLPTWEDRDASGFLSSSMTCL